MRHHPRRRHHTLVSISERRWFSVGGVAASSADIVAIAKAWGVVAAVHGRYDDVEPMKDETRRASSSPLSSCRKWPAFSMMTGG